jgi:hypothetical protein
MTLNGCICMMSNVRRVTYTITQSLNEFETFVVLNTDSERAMVYHDLVEAIQETLKLCQQN